MKNQLQIHLTMLLIQVISKWVSHWLPLHLLKLGLHQPKQPSTLINMLTVNTRIHSSTILSKATTLNNSMHTMELREAMEDIILEPLEHLMLTTTLTNITTTSITITMALVHIPNNINNSSNNQFKYKHLFNKQSNPSKKVKMSK